MTSYLQKVIWGASLISLALPSTVIGVTSDSKVLEETKSSSSTKETAEQLLQLDVEENELHVGIQSFIKLKIMNNQETSQTAFVDFDQSLGMELDKLRSDLANVADVKKTDKGIQLVVSPKVASNVEVSLTPTEEIEKTSISMFSNQIPIEDPLELSVVKNENPTQSSESEEQVSSDSSIDESKSESSKDSLKDDVQQSSVNNTDTSLRDNTTSTTDSKKESSKPVIPKAGPSIVAKKVAVDGSLDSSGTLGNINWSTDDKKDLLIPYYIYAAGAFPSSSAQVSVGYSFYYYASGGYQNATVTDTVTLDTHSSDYNQNEKYKGAVEIPFSAFQAALNNSGNKGKQMRVRLAFTSKETGTNIVAINYNIYPATGSLKFTAPTEINFGTNLDSKITTAPTDWFGSIQGDQLTVTDTRVFSNPSTNAWTVTATATQEMTNIADASNILEGSLKYIEAGTTKSLSDGNVQVTPLHPDGESKDPVKISADWGIGSGKGIIFSPDPNVNDIKPGASYQGQIEWYLQSVPK